MEPQLDINDLGIAFSKLAEAYAIEFNRLDMLPNGRRYTHAELADSFRAIRQVNAEREGEQMRNDGGPAFPAAHPLTASAGMSLRDYFAAAALQGAIASPVRHTDTQGEDITALADYARLAYGYADALLAERDKS